LSGRIYNLALKDPTSSSVSRITAQLEDVSIAEEYMFINRFKKVTHLKTHCTLLFFIVKCGKKCLKKKQRQQFIAYGSVNKHMNTANNANEQSFV